MRVCVCVCMCVCACVCVCVCVCLYVSVCAYNNIHTTYNANTHNLPVPAARADLQASGRAAGGDSVPDKRGRVRVPCAGFAHDANTRARARTHTHTHTCILYIPSNTHTLIHPF